MLAFSFNFQPVRYTRFLVTLNINVQKSLIIVVYMGDSVVVYMGDNGILN